MAVNTRVRATPESIVGDEDIQHQRHRTRRIREVTSQLNVPTSLTPAPSHLLRFYFVGCAKEVSSLINRPVVSLFGTRVGGTGTNMIAKSINSKLFATTSREWKLHQDRYCCTDTSGKKGLPKASRSCLISVMWSDLPQPTHRLVPKYTSWGILLLRLYAGHLC